MVTKVLEFVSSEDARKFGFIYAGFLIGGTTDKPKSIAILRQEARVFDKLEAISSPTGQTFDGTSEARILKEEFPISLKLELPEWEMIQKYIEATPWKSGVSREVVTTLDWIRDAKKEE